MSKNIVPFSKEFATQLIDSVEAFPVDFDLAWLWLSYSTKGNAKRCLARFREGKDFIRVDKISETKPIQCFWLTVDCFKSLAMMAQTDQGDQVREYFLECERIVKRIDQRDPRLVLLDELSAITHQQIALEKRQVELDLENQRLRLEQIQIKAEQAQQAETLLQHDAEIGRIFEPDGMLITLAGCLNLHGKRATAAQLSQVGRFASKLFRDKYDKEPEKIGDARFGKVFAYPSAIAEIALTHFGYI